MNHTIGIDFGTTKTLVSCVDPATGLPRPIRLGRGTDYLPTTIYALEGGRFLFGDAADDEQELGASRYCRGFKMELGSDYPVLGFDEGGEFREYTARALSSEFLRHIRQECERRVFLGQPVRRTVITCPVSFSRAQQADLKAAAEQAGFREVELLTEPEAAGLAFCHLCPETAFHGNALVVDWGGGTLDMALVSRRGGRIEVHHQYRDGSALMGGEHFDDLLWQHVADRLRRDYGCDPGAESPEAQGRIRTRLRWEKERLSEQEQCTLRLSGGQRPLPPLPLHRAEFEKLIAAELDAAVRMATRLCESIRELSCKPEMLLLVGGTSEIPSIARAMTAALGLPCHPWQYAREAVSFGAALLSAPRAEAGCLSPGLVALMQRAEQGDAEARYQLGDLYEGGFAGLANLAARFEEGRGLPKSEAEAEALFEAALRAGRPNGHDMLWPVERLCHLRDRRRARGAPAPPRCNIPTSPEEAYRWYLKSAQQGHYWGSFNVAKCYECGIGVPVSLRRACELYEEAARLPLPEGEWVNHAQLRGDALKAYLNAEHDAWRQFELGDAYYNGCPMGQSYARALYWYRRSAEQGCYWGLFNVGKCYEYGHGVAADARSAAEWYERASRVGAPADAGGDWAKVRADMLRGHRPQRIYYWTDKPNFGDALNVDLARYLKIPHEFVADQSQATLIYMGSLLAHIQYLEGCEVKVLGCGFLTPPEGEEHWVRRNAHFVALRGTLSRDRLERLTGRNLQNVVLGDPGLLIRRIFPQVKRSCFYELGVICHWKDANSPTLQRLQGCGLRVKLIDIFQGTESFVREVASCNFILSSALHGLICADSLGIPNRHLVLGDEVEGGSYKFRDYYSAYDGIDYQCFDLRTNELNAATIERLRREYRITPEQVGAISDRLEAAARQVCTDAAR